MNRKTDGWLIDFMCRQQEMSSPNGQVDRQAARQTDELVEVTVGVLS